MTMTMTMMIKFPEIIYISSFSQSYSNKKTKW